AALRWRGQEQVLLGNLRFLWRSVANSSYDRSPLSEDRERRRAGSPGPPFARGVSPILRVDEPPGKKAQGNWARGELENTPFFIGYQYWSFLDPRRGGADRFL